MPINLTPKDFLKITKKKKKRHIPHEYTAKKTKKSFKKSLIWSNCFAENFTQELKEKTKKIKCHESVSGTRRGSKGQKWSNRAEERAKNLTENRIYFMIELAHSLEVRGSYGPEFCPFVFFF